MVPDFEICLLFSRTRKTRTCLAPNLFCSQKHKEHHFGVSRTVFKNIENNILVLSKNCSCSLNLVLFVFSKTKKKKLGTNSVLYVFLILLSF